jgi:tetratricopeptide (TPR) repeat protein
MRKRHTASVLVALLALGLVGVGCNLVQARASFKDGNKLYREENYRAAIGEYERAVELKPDFAEAHFYLASAHQALYRPGKDDPENREHLDRAIQHFTRSLEVNTGRSDNQRTVKINALGALTAIYADPPLQDYEKALAYAEELVKDNPNDTKNLYAMANLYEKFGRVGEAERTYLRVTEQNPGDTKACGALAAFYNKPLWDDRGEVYSEGSDRPRRSQFEKAIETLKRCAELEPTDPSGHYKVATFYWDKAYRDPLLGDREKDAYADRGIEAVDRALSMKPDYWEAIISKGLLFRVKAQVARSGAERKRYLDQAQILQKQALELRKEQQEQAAASAAAVTPEAATTP